jgi:hypothetical protein
MRNSSGCDSPRYLSEGLNLVARRDTTLGQDVGPRSPVAIVGTDDFAKA